MTAPKRPVSIVAAVYADGKFKYTRKDGSPL